MYDMCTKDQGQNYFLKQLKQSIFLRYYNGSLEAQISKGSYKNVPPMQKVTKGVELRGNICFLYTYYWE